VFVHDADTKGKAFYPINRSVKLFEADELGIKPNYLKVIKRITFLAGFIFGFILFWKGFGIGMCSNENDSDWVMHYVYWSLWPIIPAVFMGHFYPRLGGLAFLGNSFWSSYLLYQVWINKISWVTSEDIFTAYHGKYNPWVTGFSEAVPMLALGLAFLFIGWQEGLMADSKKEMEGK